MHHETITHAGHKAQPHTQQDGKGAQPLDEAQPLREPGDAESVEGESAVDRLNREALADAQRHKAGELGVKAGLAKGFSAVSGAESVRA